MPTSSMPPVTLRFQDEGAIPNHPTFPALLYRSVPAVSDGGAEGAVALFARHDWTRAWTDGLIYPFHHFHSTAHEVLAITAGGTRLLLGGPSGEELDVAAGDVIVLPAGTGHCRVGGTGGLAVTGAYAGGRAWDLMRGDPAEDDAAVERIAKVPRPSADPVTGGPIW